MNELIISNGTAKMSSLDIAELMDKRHDHVMRDIKSLISQEAINAPNFGAVEYQDAKGEMRPMYLLDFDATMILITGYDAKRRAAIIKRWRELETGVARPAFQVPQTLSEALRLAADLAETVQVQAVQIEQNQPKVEFADAVSESKHGVDMALFAKSFEFNGEKMGRNKIYKFLRNHRYLMSGVNTWNIPFQRYIDQGWFIVKEGQYENDHSNGPRVFFKTLITGRGQIAISKMLTEHFAKAA